MTIVALRIFLFSILPLLIAAGHVGLDRSVRSRERRLEIFLLYLFGLGVAAGGVGGFVAHFFISDLVAESIGWPAGSPFQLEVAFANLALGILGIVAVGRRDGFREATVVAVTVFGVGATIVHVMDFLETGNLAPGNSLQSVSNLLKPALLIGLLTASRRAERSPESEVHAPPFEAWRAARVQGAGLMTACVATGFGVGFSLDRPLVGAVIGIFLGVGLVALLIARAPDQSGGRTISHEAHREMWYE